MREPFAPDQLLTFYLDHLQNVLLPFWRERAMDEEYGGYFTCFENSGERLLSTDKFTWSQGRMVWVLAKLATLPHLAPAERERYLRWAAAGADFLQRHCLLPNGHCAFLLDRQGNPKPQEPGQALDSSAYADCFVILGLSRYARTSGEEAPLEFARRLYASVVQRAQEGTFKTEPYPTPKGYRVHGIPMILLNVSQELAQALRERDDPSAAQVEARAEAFKDDILQHFVHADLVQEMITTENRPEWETLLGRYINPGHTLEDMWFILHQAMAREDRKVVEQAARIIIKTFQVGWDETFGGLFLFVDREGGQPRGSIAGLAEEKMVHKVRNDWDSKLWWPHSEALYTTLLAYHLTGDPEFLALYRRVADYTFATFPHPDPKIGEWIQIRDRQGRPEQKVVALPVKDPFHILRNVILIIELLDTMLANPTPTAGA